MRTSSRRSPSLLHRTPVFAAVACALAAQPVAAATYSVNSRSTLQSAIADINGRCSTAPNPSDTINVTGPFTLSLPVEMINCGNITVNGGDNTITAAGTFYAYGGGPCGLYFASSTRATVRALKMTGFSQWFAICGFMDASGLDLNENYMGVDAWSDSKIVGNNVRSTNGSVGIRAGSGSEVGVNNVSGFQSGIESSSTPITVDRNDVTARYVGIHAPGGTITGNFVHGVTGDVEVNGLGIYAAHGATVTGNFVYANDTGIYVSYGGTVSGNSIGSDGTTDRGNVTGLIVDGQNSTPGYNVTGNTIVANLESGVEVISAKGATFSGNTIARNEYGLEFMYGGPITVNGNNVIAANSGRGVGIYGSTDILFQSNTIGTSGSMAGNGGRGIDAYCADTLVFSGNDIQGNGAQGLYGGALTSSTISANTINGNGGSGIDLGGGNCDIPPLDTFRFQALRGKLAAAAQQVRRKGLEAGDPSNNNSISGNSIRSNGHGVSPLGDGIILSLGTGNIISGNEINSNARKNINLGGSTQLLNDTGDTDGDGNGIPESDTTVRPNRWQNYPVISQVLHEDGNTFITYTLDSDGGGGTTYQIEFFKNDAAGGQAGQHFLTPPRTLTLTGPGPVTERHMIPGLHTNITATATSGPRGDTSEFSEMKSTFVEPGVSIAPNPVGFGNVNVGTSSPDTAVTIASNGTADYKISAVTSSPSCSPAPICSSGDFVCTTTCSTTTPYANGSSCTVTGRFAPNTTGPQSTTIYICDNTGTGPKAITFSGTGLSPSALRFVPNSHDFGAILVGEKSDSFLFALSNPGDNAAPIGALTVTSDFTLKSTTCIGSIMPHSSCIADVQFTPARPGQITGTLSVSAATGPAPVSTSPTTTATTAALSGAAVQMAVLGPTSAVDLGAYVLGRDPIRRSVQLTNTGNAVLTFSSISVTPPFTVENGCPLNLQPGAGCTVNVVFSSTTIGDFSGTLTVTSNADGGPRSIPVTAHAQPVPVPVIRFSPATIGFGDRLAFDDRASESQRVTITNEGSAEAALGGFDAGLDFLVSTSCGATLAPQSSCFADVRFRPIGFGPRGGTLRFTSNAEGSPHTVTLSGTGCRPFPPTSRLGTRSNCQP